jgi:hypothetical protein
MTFRYSVRVRSAFRLLVQLGFQRLRDSVGIAGLLEGILRLGRQLVSKQKGAQQ